MGKVPGQFQWETGYDAGPEFCCISASACASYCDKDPFHKKFYWTGFYRNRPVARIVRKKRVHIKDLNRKTLSVCGLRCFYQIAIFTGRKWPPVRIESWKKRRSIEGQGPVNWKRHKDLVLAKHISSSVLNYWDHLWSIRVPCFPIFMAHYL